MAWQKAWSGGILLGWTHVYIPQRSPFAGPGHVEAPLLDTHWREALAALCLFACFIRHDLEKSINDGKTRAST